MKGLSVCFTLLLCGLLHFGSGVSTKVDFEEDATNSSKEDEDVEVKHTIVVSTKLKNAGNRRGLHGSDDPATLTYNIGRNKAKEDSGEVPIIKGYRAVDTTQIRTPDTRFKPTQPSPQTTSFVINRNIRDDYDIYPNLAINPGLWKPSTYFNNINWWNQEPRDSPNFVRRIDRPYQNDGKLRKLAEDSTKEFYCRKCREMSGKVCQIRSYAETTTAKMKIDGKLAKLN